MKLIIGKTNGYDIDKTNIVCNDRVSISNSDKKNLYSVPLNNNSVLMIYGTIYAISSAKSQFKFNATNNCIERLGGVFNNFTIEEAVQYIEGRFIGVLIKETSEVIVFNDKHAQIELYYIKHQNYVVASTSIKELVADLDHKEYDQVAIANILGIYGNYSPKKHTIYKGIRRLGLGESVKLKDDIISFSQKVFVPKKIENYCKDNLQEYVQLFRKSIEVRSSNTTNWVYMSSGWDSSSVLAVLCDIHGSSNVRAVIGRAKYSNLSGICNNFEVERAQAITSHFGVELDIVELDYTTNDYLSFWDEIRDDFRSNHLYALFAYNFFKLAKYIKDNGKKTDAVFNGELSDGAHNLGFSQFATILDHQDVNFREYSDKMACYLYSPSFFKQIENNNFSNDAVFNLLKNRSNNSVLNSVDKLKDDEWKYKYISSFFLSSSRIPFAEPIDSNMFTEFGRGVHKKEINDVYFHDFAHNITSDTLYSWILHLYHSFHWQSGGVRGMMMSSEYYGMQTSAPFSDTSMLDFLSVMPESWGRGLDFNRTKYPLKWMLKNKPELNYPLHLQTGPHSYTYDVDPDWSADADIVYDSAGAEYFKLLLKDHPYEEILDPKYFNIKYINQLVDNYCNGIIESGQKRADLKNIISLCNVGWY